jgi:outer membrane protein assembly factor BamE
MLRKLLPITIICTLLIALSGCYRVPVAQGNLLTEKNVAAIKKGMSPRQVIAKLGTPVLNNIYVENRMVYVYTFRPTYGDMTEKRFIIYFNNGKISSFTTDPEAISAALPAPAAEKTKK